MSQYTYPYGYGQYPGLPPPPPPPPPPQQQQPLYGYQPLQHYPPPTYNQHQDPRAAEINRAASQNSFNYNANQIPGLGIGPPPVATAYGVVPDPGGWSQPQFAASVPGLVPPPQVSTATTFNAAPHPAAPWAAPTAPSAQRTAQPPSIPPTKRQPTPNHDVEEGELSEGQFEDLYEPREPAQPSSSSQNQPQPPPATNPSRPASVIDTPEAGFYGNDDEEGEITTKDNTDTVAARDRSGSYSPFLSPREIQTENTTPQAVAGEGDGPSSPFLAPNQSAMLKAASHSQQGALLKNGNERSQTVPGLQYTSPQLVGAVTGQSQLKDGAPVPNPSLATLGPFTSLQEAKKEAQKAILRLWPLGVKFHHYIDEGFDQKVIKNLFGDLHLDMPKPEAESTKTTGQESESSKIIPSGSQPTQSANMRLSTTNAKEQSLALETSAKGEERKDRIARLLAAKAAKTPASPITKPPSPQLKSASAQAEHQEHGPSAASLPKNKTWGEKERLLQQKIAALQKSREAQAQKPATEEAGLGVTEPEATGGVPDSNAIRSHQSTSRASKSQEDPVQSSVIPGLLLPSATQPNQIAAHRKRPVAADFVEYSSTVGPTKRPFGQDRYQSSLIIDVSDGSDDEEMDMDMESPTEEPLASRGDAFGQRGPLIRDYPPLTDTLPSRQFSSPVPISQTPPSGPTNGRRRETELDLKEKAIQEMRRKIAEAEAKQKAKKSSGSQTPNQASHTPEFKENEVIRPASRQPIYTDSFDGPSAQLMSETFSARLPKNTDRFPPNQLEKAERRGRIVSFELPRIDDSLEEKVRRLNQLRDEEQRLKSEIDNELARKKILTEELQQINITPSENHSQPSGVSSANSSVTNSPTGSAPVEQVTSASGSLSDASDQGLHERGDGASDISMDEDQSSRDSSQNPTSREEPSQGVHHGTSDIASANIEVESEANSNSLQSSHVSEADDDHRRNVIPDAEEDGGTDLDASAPLEIAEQLCATRPDEETTKADKDTHGDLEKAEHDLRTEVEFRSPSPPQLDPAADHMSTDEDMERSPDVEQLDQISSVGQPREDVQETEGVATEMTVEPGPNSEHRFRPYTTPLRYFHAYRYHPDYPSTVAGGLKSLTYSNRIDPKKVLCPYELIGQQCPENCDFQHFGSICVPDDQILVELGRSDDYIGEQKNRFIQGLRELLQEFRAKKVKDFDTISRGIIDYRASFLGDKSKVLNLEGVTL